MKAVRLNELGGPEKFVIEEIDKPKPGAGEVLVHLRHAAFNRRDVFITQGLYPGITLPRTLGSDGAGEIGFISSVTQPFCGNCTRARLSSEGKFYTCLFATRGLDLRAALRAGAPDREISELIRGEWLGRNDRYSELRDELRRADPQQPKIEMYYIGG